MSEKNDIECVARLKRTKEFSIEVPEKRQKGFICEKTCCKNCCSKAAADVASICSQLVLMVAAISPIPMKPSVY